MARSPQIANPVKVTLYMPKGVSEPAKEFARTQGTSLSALVTDLLETEMSGNVKHTIEVDPEINEKINKLAEASGGSVQNVFNGILASFLQNDNIGN